MNSETIQNDEFCRFFLKNASDAWDTAHCFNIGIVPNMKPILDLSVQR